MAHVELAPSFFYLYDNPPSSCCKRAGHPIALALRSIAPLLLLRKPRSAVSRLCSLFDRFSSFSLLWKYRHIVADCQLKKLAACKIAPGRVPRRANSKQSRGLTCTCVTTFDGGPTRWVEELCMENVVEYPAAA